MRNTIALITTLAVILIAAPSLAKGPMSATITGPGIEEPIELMGHFEQDLAPLFELTGIWRGTKALQAMEAPPRADELGAGFTLTWVNMGPPHLSEQDRSIRQIIYPHADMGPVIHTPEQQILEGWGPGAAGWWLAPPALVDAFNALGVEFDDGQEASLPEPAWLVLLALAAAIAAGARLVNSRLRPVVSSQ